MANWHRWACLDIGNSIFLFFTCPNYAIKLKLLKVPNQEDGGKKRRRLKASMFCMPEDYREKTQTSFCISKCSDPNQGVIKFFLLIPAESVCLPGLFCLSSQEPETFCLSHLPEWMREAPSFLRIVLWRIYCGISEIMYCDVKTECTYQ